MRDEFAGQRLPDLPNAGYSTQREKQCSDELMMFIRGCERNRRLLLTIVKDGKQKFRKIARKAWAHVKADHETCDSVYVCLVATAFPQFALAHPDYTQWNEHDVKVMAWRHLDALEAYEQQTMAQRVQNSQAALELQIQEALKRRRH